MSLTDLEKDCLRDWRESGGRRRRAGSAAPGDADWLRLGLFIVLDAGRRIRELRITDFSDAASMKTDGTPVTRIEHEIEVVAEERLRDGPERVTLVGEETGGRVPEKGLALAIDPVDGTWSLFNRTETAATTLAFLRDGETFLGLVSNPATGEIAYSFATGPTRLLQLSAIGVPDLAATLPLEPIGPTPLLVHLHPARGAGALVMGLYGRWRTRDLHMVRMTGGSPALGLLEAAKGAFAYANLWGKRESEAWDLAAALTIVRGAGGEVVDLAGRPLAAVGHKGPFVAAIDTRARGQLVAWVREIVDSGCE
mgnify:CR=1 FL=1